MGSAYIGLGPLDPPSFMDSSPTFSPLDELLCLLV